MLLFVWGGLSVCLLSSYISTFLTAFLQIDYITATITVVPIVEEIMKLLPILFYLLVFEPKGEDVPACIFMIACGFATLENVCYLVLNGSDRFFDLLIRGFGTGAMHVICGVIMVVGIMTLWENRWLRAAGIFGLLSAVITYHGIYNMLVLQPGSIAIVGYLIPLFSALLYKILFHPYKS